MSDTGRIKLAQSSFKEDAPHSQGFSILLSGASIILIGAVLGRVLDFITRTMIGRHFGPGNFGLLNGAIALLSIMAVIVSLGIPTGIVRFIGRYKGEEKPEDIPKLAHNTFWLITCIAVLAGFALLFVNEWLAIHLLNEPAMAPLLRLVAIALPIITMLSLTSALFQAERESKSYVLVNNLLLPLTRLSGIFLAIVMGWAFIQISSFYIVGALIPPLILGFVLIRQTPFSLWSADIPKTKNLLPPIRFSLPLLVGSLFGLAIWQVDLLLLQREWGAEETGLYAAALTIGRLPGMILLAFSFVLAPVAAELFSAGRITRMRYLYERTVEALFFLALPITAIIILYAAPLLHLLFGAAYVTAAPVLRILAAGFFLQVITGPNGNTIIMMGYSRRYLTYTLIAGTVTIGLYLLLISPLGKIGAALATVTGILLLNGIFAWQLYRAADINPLRSLRLDLFIPLILALMTTLVLKQLAGHLLPSWLMLLILIAVIVTLYISLAVLFQMIQPQELQALRRLISRNGQV
jgi:O-antigen/teichoic acid export membrane protein